MSKKRTSSELQAYIQQRYDDTSFVIHRERQAKKKRNLTGFERNPPKLQQAFENIAEVEQNHLQAGRAVPQPAPGNNVQSLVCVII